MPRLSRHLDLKPEILEHYSRGLTAWDVCKLYPNLSRGTAYDWFRSFTEQHKHKAEPETDFELARRTLREIAEDKAQPDPRLLRARIEAVKILIELIKLRRDTPKHILEEQDQTDRQVIEKRVEDMSIEELDKRYKELLQKSREET